jgi:hypothetical protein
MGSSDITSRFVAQTTDDTGLAAAGVMATKPLTGETLPGGEFADRPQEATSAHAAAAMIIHRVGRASVLTRRPIPATCLDAALALCPVNPSLTDGVTCHHPAPDLTYGDGNQTNRRCEQVKPHPGTPSVPPQTAHPSVVAQELHRPGYRPFEWN